MSRFKPGQQIVCVYDRWQFPGPKKNELCTVESCSKALVFGKEWDFVYLVGYNYKYHGLRINYNELHFEPLQDLSEQIKEALTEKVTPAPSGIIILYFEKTGNNH